MEELQVIVIFVLKVGPPETERSRVTAIMFITLKTNTDTSFTQKRKNYITLNMTFIERYFVLKTGASKGK